MVENILTFFTDSCNKIVEEYLSKENSLLLDFETETLTDISDIFSYWMFKDYKEKFDYFLSNKNQD